MSVDDDEQFLIC